jgi:hypothetical protein
MLSSGGTYSSCTLALNNEDLSEFQSEGTLANLSFVVAQHNKSGIFGIGHVTAWDCVLYMCAKLYTSNELLELFNEQVNAIFNRPLWNHIQDAANN